MTRYAGVAVALVGPTASGKSALGHAFAVERGGDVEILAVDAMTVYRGMNIGTAKASARQRHEVPYHLVDLVDPDEEFTLAQYQRCAREAAATVWGRRRIVLYVGGTGLYGRAVLDNFEIPPHYPQLRLELNARVERELSILHSQLVELDPVAASRMEATNARRVVRALEVTLGSGRPFSSYGTGVGHYGRVRVVQVGLRCTMDELDQRIVERFRVWLDEGFVREVAGLAARPGGLSRTARQAVGYRELLRHVEEGADLEQCVLEAIAQSRRLARRQRSWFQRDPRVEWFDDATAARERLHAVVNGSDGFVRD